MVVVSTGDPDFMEGGKGKTDVSRIAIDDNVFRYRVEGGKMTRSVRPYYFHRSYSAVCSVATLKNDRACSADTLARTRVKRRELH